MPLHRRQVEKGELQRRTPDSQGRKVKSRRKQREAEGRGERGDVRSGTAERIRGDGSSFKSMEVDGRKDV